MEAERRLKLLRKRLQSQSGGENLIRKSLLDRSQYNRHLYHDFSTDLQLYDHQTLCCKKSTSNLLTVQSYLEKFLNDHELLQQRSWDDRDIKLIQ